MHDLLLDARHALRGLRKSPAFTLVAVVSLALAIGANGFVFAVLQTIDLRPAEIADPGSLYQLRYGPRTSGSNLTTSYPAFQDLRRRNAAFTDLVGVYAYSQARLGDAQTGPQLAGVAVSANYFDVLGAQAQVGRLFHDADDRGPGSAPYVVLSDAAWRRLFDGDPSVVGRAVRLAGEPFTVVGVAAPSFHGTERFAWPDYWIPVVNNLGGTDYLQDRGRRALLVIGRLKPGVTEQQATGDLNALVARLAQEHPRTDRAIAMRLIRPGLLGDDGAGIRRFLLGVNLLALLLLAAVCVNLASAFAARATDRSRELAVRVALGSSRLRLVRQVLTEALLVAAAGSAAGIAGAHGLLGALNRWPGLLGGGNARLDLDLDPRVYLAALALAVVSALVIGLLPSRQAWSGSPLQAIKAGPVSATRRRFSAGDGLLVAQIAICALLVAASFVAVRGMRAALAGTDAGIRPQGVTLAAVDLAGVPAGRVPLDDAAADRLLQSQKALLDAVRALPGVTAAGAVRETPMTWPRRVVPVYRPGTADRTPENQAFVSHVYPMSPDYLQAAGTRLVEGRDVSWHDARDTPAVAVVNRTFARTLWGDAPALGQRLLLGEREAEVVGIVEDGKYYNLMESPAAAAFVPMAQQPPADTVLVVRSSLPDAEIAAALTRTVASIDPTARVTVRTWPAALAGVFYPARAAAFALGVMGLFAALLAVTGIFGMAAHGVSRRLRELGIRAALGARGTQVLTAAVGRPAVLLGIGSALGLLAAVCAGRLLGRIVYQPETGSVAVLLGTVAAMAVVGIAGAAIPGLRALKVDPSRLMRSE